MLSQPGAKGIKYVLCNSTRKGSFYCLQALSQAPFPFADFALHAVIEISHSRKGSYMLSPEGPPPNHQPGQPWGLPNTLSKSSSE